MEVLLKDEDVRKLDNLLGEIPAKYAIPVITFVSQLITAQQQAASAAAISKSIETDKGELKKDISSEVPEVKI